MEVITHCLEKTRVLNQLFVDLLDQAVLGTTRFEPIEAILCQNQDHIVQGLSTWKRIFKYKSIFFFCKEYTDSKLMLRAETLKRENLVLYDIGQARSIFNIKIGKHVLFVAAKKCNFLFYLQNKKKKRDALKCKLYIFFFF